MIYLVVGKSCSGKTQAREYLQSRLELPGFEASAFFKEAFGRHLVENPSDLFGILGEDFVAREIGLQIPMNSGAIISGFRKKEEIAHIRTLGETRVIGLNAEDRTCYERARSRGRDEYKTFMDFYTKKICADYAMGLAEVMANETDVIIGNETNDLNALHASLDKFLGELK